MSKPRVHINIELSDRAATVYGGPPVSPTLTLEFSFNYGDAEAALRVLDSVHEQVRSQIAEMVK